MMRNAIHTNNGKRIGAFAIDFLIACTIQGVLLTCVAFYASTHDRPAIILFGNLICTIICFIYILLKDITGQSIGKRCLKLRIQNSDGTKIPSKGKMVLRNLPIILWPVEMILLLSSGKRLGDRMTNTKVIDVNRIPTGC